MKNSLTKILVLTYYFVPGNFAGSYRVASWVKSLHLHGFYPVVITRHWNKNESKFTGLSKETNIEVKKYDTYTLVQLPYFGTIRDRLVSKYGTKSNTIGKLFSLVQLIGQNFSLRSVAFKNMFQYADEYLYKNPDTGIVLTSGKPFILFRFCYLLKRKHPLIKWIADYRDPWTSETNDKKSLKAQFFRYLDKPFEKKWLQSADQIITVSTGVAESINSIISHSKPIGIVQNGFEDFYDYTTLEKENNFSVAYIGTLYPEQNIEIFIKGFLAFSEANKGISTKLKFYGLANDPNQVKRVQTAFQKRNELFETFERQPKEDLMKQVAKSSSVLLCGMPDRKGTYTAKLMDYFALRKNIYLCPSDNDALHELITQSQAGRILNTVEDVKIRLQLDFNEWLANGLVKYTGNYNVINKFKTDNQVKKLAEILNEV